MSLGNTYNNNDKKNYSPNVYSNYRMNNVLSTVDQTSLGFAYWNGSLKISIAPKKPDSPNEKPIWDNDNAILIYLTHTKARILHEEILKFLSDPIKYNNCGVPSGKGLITISNGQEFGVESPCIVVRKLKDDNSTDSTFVYQFKNDYHYAYRNYDESTSSFDKCIEDYKNLEIEQLLTLLKSYYESMTNAVAYSIIDQEKFNNSRINTKLDMIGGKLGIKFGKPGTSESAFSNRKPSGNTNYNSTNLDDVSSQFEE